MEGASPIKILIVDDEPAAHTRLEDLLRRERDTLIVGQARNGRQALSAIQELEPDLVFLDVQMPGMTGLEVVQHIQPHEMPFVIFTTAYDQYAIKAFDVAAIDYLLKPFDDERFEQSLARARQALVQRELDELQRRLAALVGHLSNAPTHPDTPQDYLQRIAVESRGQLRIVAVDSIDFISASGPYAELHVGETTHLISEQMQTLDERLDPERFFRIHRSTIVQLDRVETLLVGAGGDYAVCLTDGRKLKVSRRRWDDLVQRLGLDSTQP